MKERRWPYPGLAAHRGAGKQAPENTLAALKLGYSLGYRMAEFDVKLSGDGVSFLLHDATLQRTTNGWGRADALTWRELAQLDAGAWHSPPYAGEPLATLGSIASFCCANSMAVNIEIKPTPGRERETGAAVALDTLLHWHDSGGPPPLLSSFSDAALAAARDAAPDLPRAYLFSRLPVDWIERCQALGCVAIDVKHSVLRPALVQRAHDAGLGVLAWTVNEPDRVRTLSNWGVDTIITDAVHRIPPARFT